MQRSFRKGRSRGAVQTRSIQVKDVIWEIVAEIGECRDPGFFRYPRLAGEAGGKQHFQPGISGLRQSTSSQPPIRGIITPVSNRPISFLAYYRTTRKASWPLAASSSEDHRMGGRQHWPLSNASAASVASVVSIDCVASAVTIASTWHRGAISTRRGLAT